MSYDYKRIKNEADDVQDVRSGADNITDKLDKQAVENFELNLQVNKYKSELRHALQQLDEHSYCPGDVDIQCKQDKCAGHCEQAQPVQPAPQVEPIHGADCHCSKCCPNPNPNFFQKHKVGILITVIWIMMIFLGIGWTPQGAVAEAIQNSWVELFVNVFKVGMFAIAGIATYNLAKKGND